MDILEVGSILKPKGNGDQLVIVLKKFRLLPFGEYTLKMRNLHGQATITWTESEILSRYEPVKFDPVLARLLYID